jgi:hypothetical protein
MWIYAQARSLTLETFLYDHCTVRAMVRPLNRLSSKLSDPEVMIDQ